jgi:hypothetical protein
MFTTKRERSHVVLAIQNRGLTALFRVQWKEEDLHYLQTFNQFGDNTHLLRWLREASTEAWLTANELKSGAQFHSNT